MDQKQPVAITHDLMVSWQKRLLNLLIDLAVVILLFVLIGIVGLLMSLAGNAALLNWMVSLDGTTDRLLTTAVMVLYLFITELCTGGRTVGKYITGTIVVMDDGTKLTPKGAAIRALCRILWFEALSFFGQKPRGWHDTASDTYVVDARKYRAAQQLHNSFEEIGTTQLQ